MSAGFEFNGNVFWGTNGAIEAYVEMMAEQSSTHFGPEHPWTRFFRELRECFYPGKVVPLDDLVTDAESRARLIGLIDLATDELSRRELLSESGKQWVAATMPSLCRHIEASAAKAG